MEPHHSISGTPPRILLVDDIELNRVLTEAVLRGATYEVDSVGDGNAALRALDDKTYDLVLMDLDMPGLDGHSAALAIRRRESATRGSGNPPVVALSASGSTAIRDRSREAGMADHILRPIAPVHLLREVERLLAEAARRDGTSNVWCRETYADLVNRLGEERMRHFVSSLLDQCSAMRTSISTGGSKSEIERRAHDLVSVGGMLGFATLSAACFEIQAVPAGPIPERALRRVSVALDRVIDMLTIHLGETATAA